MKKIAENSKNFYNGCLSKHGKSAKGLNWKNKQTQFLRFKILSRIGKINNHSIHDFGCGFGDLFTLLKKDHNSFDYIGTDISQEMISIARQKHKSKNFFVFDLINSNFQSSFVKDYVISSGVFTVKNEISNGLWLKYLFKGVEKMFNYSRLGIGFNLMTSEVDFKDKNLFYIDPITIIKFLEKNISSKVKIINSYNLWDYTVFVYK